jgi:hypothetical protein
MNHLGRWATNVGKAVSLGIAGLIVGLAVRARSPDAAPPPLSAPRLMEDVSVAEVAHINGTLSRSSLAQLSIGASGYDSLVVVLIAEKDCLTCEDLGRQIRNLVASVSNQRMVLLASPIADSVRVEQFTRAERLGLRAMYLSAALTLEDGSTIPTPAAIVVDRAGVVLRGVAHLVSVKNVRAVSFAEELGYVPTGVLPLLKTDRKEDSR